jgi:hypothetical protein
MSEAFPEMPSLTVVGGPLDGYEMKLSPGTTVMVGSGRLAHMRVDHPDVELAHIKVSWDDFGISMIDNGSRKGTWVNGEPVETAALLDGDVIEFAAPDSKSAPPKIKIRIPAGSVPEAPPPPPEPPSQEPGRMAPLPGPVAPAPARRPAARRQGRRRRLPFDVPDLRLVGLAVLGLVVVLVVGWAAKWMFFTAPQITSVQPGQAEPGALLTIDGKRFSSDAEKNLIWFGDRSFPASSVTGDTLQVRVPPFARAGAVALSLQNPRGRSGSLRFVVLTALKAVALDPVGALPGDEVTLSGQGFVDGEVKVTVGGAEAKVLAADAGSVRFEMPRVAGEPGSRHPVLASVKGRSTAPLDLYLGRVPLVLSFDPNRAVCGELVRIGGVGFAPAPGANRVTFDGVQALVVAASATRLVVVAPPPARPLPETQARVAVQVGGKTSSADVTFPLLQLVEGAWVPRFVAGAVGGATPGQAVVGTEIAPVILLADKDDARTVGERAVQVAAAINRAVDRARVGQQTAFEAREEPAVGVAVAGSPDLFVRATPQDAAAYATAEGASAGAAPPSAPAVARYWAALLNDYLAIGTSGSQPGATAALSPAGGAVLAQLRASLPWQYGSGVATARVLALSPDLRRRLREIAFRVP